MTTLEDLKKGRVQPQSRLWERYQMIGKAVKQVPDSVISRNLMIPYQDNITEMRNKLVHAYSNTHIAIIWEAVQNSWA